MLNKKTLRGTKKTSKKIIGKITMSGDEYYILQNLVNNLSVEFKKQNYNDELKEKVDELESFVLSLRSGSIEKRKAERDISKKNDNENKDK